MVQIRDYTLGETNSSPDHLITMYSLSFYMIANKIFYKDNVNRMQLNLFKTAEMQLILCKGNTFF